MSMSQANAALVMDVYAETARLGITLTEAERIVDGSAKRMGQKIDGSFAQVGDKIVKMLGGAIGAGLAVKVVDDALRKVADGIREGQGAGEIGMAIADSIAASIKAVPVAGAITDIVSQLADPLFGSPEGMKQARENAMAMQRARMEGEKAYQELLAQGASEEEAADMAKRKRIESLREYEAKALQQYNQTEKTYDEEAYQRAVEAAKGQWQTTKMGMFGDVPAEPVTVDRELFRTRESLTEEALAGRRQVSRATAAAIARVEQEFEQAARDRAAKAEATALATQEKQKRDAERIAAEEERRIKAQEEAYDRFVEGNTREAILALEAQLQAAGTAAAPTRADRLAQLMAGMTGGIGTADTALGAFTFAMGDPAEISRNILENAKSQLAALERIENIQREIAALQKGSGFN